MNLGLQARFLAGRPSLLFLAGKTTPTVISKKWGQTDDIRMTVRWLQQQMLGAFRAGVGADTLEMSRTKSTTASAVTSVSRLYERTGAFLQWPPKAVDEVLFLESIVLSLFEARTRKRRTKVSRSWRRLSLLVDSHCHVDFPEFSEDLVAVLKRASENGRSLPVVRQR